MVQARYVWVPGSLKYFFERNQSTTGAALAAILGVPHAPLDTLFWNPGWGQTPQSEFKEKVREFMVQNAETGWVIDGSYDSQLGGIISNETTDIVWLDPPLLLTFYRICVRTMLRLLRLAPPCSPGCPERASEVFFSKDSIIWWCLSHHWSMRRKGWAKMGEMALETGTNVGNRKMRRLGGWGQARQDWLDQVAAMCLERKII